MKIFLKRNFSNTFLLMLIIALTLFNKAFSLEPSYTQATETKEAQNSSDYYTVALSLLNKAKQGDGNSQFMLFKRLIECELLITPDTVTNMVSMYQKNKLAPNIKHIQSLENDLEKCSNLNQHKNQFYRNNANEWLLKAVQNKVPAAMTLYAVDVLNLLTQNNHNLFIESTELNLVQAIEMLNQSIEQGNSEGYFYLVNAYFLNIVQQAAWATVAKQKGFELTNFMAKITKFGSLLVCIDTNKEDNCYDKMDFDYLIKIDILKGNKQALKSAQIRAIEIREQLRRNNYDSLNFNHLLKGN